jgi:hypothetical protein
MSRTKDAVQIDKYAFENICMANGTNHKEVSERLGKSHAYMYQVLSNGGYMRRTDYENLKGLLRVTDSDLVKAVPVQRSDEVESIYQPVPVKKKTNIFTLDEENQEFVDLLANISGAEKSALVNGIVKAYRLGSAAYEAIAAITSEAEELTN